MTIPRWLRKRFKLWGIFIVDSGCICIWVIAQSIVDYIVHAFKISWLDQWTLIFIQVIFAIYTLVSLLSFIYEDYKKMKTIIKEQTQNIENGGF